MQIISDVDTLIFESLARYRFLTSSQMIRLGISGDKSNLHKRLVRLREQSKPFISYVKFTGIYKIKGIEYVYYLTNRGADLIAENLGYLLEDIKFPKGKVDFPKHYKHRKDCIDIQIALFEWAEKNGYVVESYDSYFDMEKAGRGKNYISKTAIVYDSENGEKFVSDGIAKILIQNHTDLFVESYMATFQFLWHLQRILHSMFGQILRGNDLR